MKGSREQQLTARIEKAKAVLKKLVSERKRLRLKASAANRKQVFNAMRLNQRGVLEAVSRANPALFKQLTEAALKAAGTGRAKKKRR